jgi:polyhydroxyalkanoate synthase subunit PhaC
MDVLPPAVQHTAAEPESILETPAQQSSRALDALVHAAEARSTFGLSPVALGLAFLDWATHLANAPFRRLELAQSAIRQLDRLLEAAWGGTVIVPAPDDHRFNAARWRDLPFNLVHQSFLLAEEWWVAACSAPAGTARADERIVSFSARQWIDMFSPSNVPWLNPEVIDATINTFGHNLLRGTVNWLDDVREAQGGPPATSGFVIGENLAATPGKVVLRNELMELIQYAPATPLVYREPILIVPAWIMKYYILDLSPHNSLIRWLVGQGNTVFAISWRNPGAEMHETSLEDYHTKGVLAAVDAVEAICDGALTHAVGYCLGGTLLSIAAAAMARDGDQRLASVTLFAAQTDFTEAGELQLFITEDQLDFLDDLMRVQGYLDTRQMAGAFGMLRSNDLIWSRLIRQYLLGEREHPSDLMAWNADGTRMPARMHSEYLHRLFLDNELAEGHFTAGGKPVSIGDIHVPLFAVGTETDHIAPWRSVHKLHLQNDGDLTFVLTSGGHNAGVVSEPGHPHRHYRIHRRHREMPYLGPDDWMAQAEQHEGSWWPAWQAWLTAHSTEKITPPDLGNEQFPPLDAAPGRYVHGH